MLACVVVTASCLYVHILGLAYSIMVLTITPFCIIEVIVKIHYISSSPVVITYSVILCFNNNGERDSHSVLFSHFTCRHSQTRSLDLNKPNESTSTTTLGKLHPQWPRKKANNTEANSAFVTLHILTFRAMTLASVGWQERHQDCKKILL